MKTNILDILNKTNREFINSLKSGDVFEFETINKEDYRVATLEYNRCYFNLCFNGKILGSYKCVISLINRFNKLNDKWNLEVKDN